MTPYMVSSTLALLCLVEYRRYFVRPSVRLSVHLFGVLSYLLAWELWLGGLGLVALAWWPWPEGFGLKALA